MSNSLRVSAHTLGCKVNQYDTGKLLEELARRGCEVAAFTEAADVCVINTCTVTHTGEMKSLQTLRRVKAAQPGIILAVCGCLVKTNEAVVREAGADIVFDARKPEELIGRLPPLNEPQKNESVYNRRRTRAYIKIQDGCDRYCSYCIVPYVRGPLASRPPEEILTEARGLIERGVKEIVLTGIQSAAYGNDNVSYPGIIKQAAALPGLVRLRLGSIEPYAVNGEFLDAITSPVVCPHFHLSLQSGCDKTLKAMNRRYTAELYRGLAEKIRSRKPGAALTTDIMVGFPGETDADFEDSYNFVNDIHFSRIHAFIYSPREGTSAAELPLQIPVTVKNERGKKMRELAGRLEKDFLLGGIGKTVQVLFEAKRSDGFCEGHTPEYTTVRVRHDGDISNTLLNVKLIEIKNGIIYGRNV